MSSEADDTAVSRRRSSGRVRKTVERLDPSSGKAKKSRKAATTSDNESDEGGGESASPDEAASDAEMDDPTTEEEADDDDFEAPRKSTGTRGTKRKSTAGGTNGRGGSQSKRGRKANGNGTTRKSPSQPRKPRGKKKQAEDGEEEEDDEGAKTGAKAPSGKDFPIDDDNGLFNAVKSPNTALQTTAEDWIESYQEDSGPAMAELVNFVLRCCGCNASIDEHQAEDENGIVENLKDIVDEFKQETNHAYPLISKSKGYKKFRSSLGQFLSKLLHAASDDILFSTSFYEHFQAWTHALSSSQIRALRHTATVIALVSIDALTTLEVSIRKEHGQAMRAKEAEAKKNRKDKARLKDMEKQVQEIHERLEAVEAFQEEAYTSVFVNRYRDADSVIRAECISALGTWMKLNPDHWIDGDYLRYIGWVLSDESKEARRDSVRALFSLYQKEAYIGKLHHFTDRFKGQLVDMAMGEHDAAVRVQAIQVVRQIDGHGLLDEEQRDEVAQLVFEKDKRVRAAAAELFKGALDEEVESRKTELNADKKSGKGKKGKAAKEDREELESMLEFKVVAELLVKYGKALDGIDPAEAEEDDDDEDERRTKEKKGVSISDLVDVKVHRGRIALAVEALWTTVESLQDWEAILSYLLKDHSVDEGSTANGKGKGKKRSREGSHEGDEEEDGDDDEAEKSGELVGAVKLTEEEESLTIELLVACLAKVTSTASSSKKDQEQDDEEQANITRAVIDALPRLFSKHQTFPVRMIDILSIPRLIQLELYHDLENAYEKLWDDVMKQFLKHTDPDVLDQAVRTIVHFLQAADLSQTNKTKFSQLEETLVSALRQCVADKEIESSTFEEDELSSLTACVARLDKLSKVKNVGHSLDDNDGGKQTSVWEILDSLANRGRLGYREEGEAIEHALANLGTHIIWQLQVIALEAKEAGAMDAFTLDTLADRRRALLEKAEEFAVGNETNTVEGVKEVALTLLLDVHVISSSITSSQFDPDHHLDSLRPKCSDELQARCAGYVEAEIERFAEQLVEEREAGAEGDDEENEDDDDGSDTEMEESAEQKKKGKKAKGKGKKAAPPKQEKRKKKSAAVIRAENARQQARLVSSQRFERSISAFVRAIHQGVFDLGHSTVLLKYWGKLGSTFDDFARLLVHDLRDEGNYGSAGDTVASVIVAALQGALEIYLDSSEESDEHIVSLGRNLLQAIVVRGAQLAIVSSLPAENHLQIHLDSLDYIVKKIKQYEETKRKEDRNKSMCFFKALAHLVLGLDGRSALKAKTHLDALFETNEIEVSATSKTWEPVRAYQKRLVTNMAKDPSIKSRAQAQAKKGKGKGKGKQATDDDEEEEAATLSGDDQAPSPQAAAVETPSRRSARTTTKRPIVEEEEEGEEQVFSPKRQRTDGSEQPEEVEPAFSPNGEAQEAEEEERDPIVDDDDREQETVEGMSGNLDNTQSEDVRPNFERADSIASAASLTDVKKRRGRK